MRDKEFADELERLLPRLEQYFTTRIYRFSYLRDKANLVEDLVWGTILRAFENSRKQPYDKFTLEQLLFYKADNEYKKFFHKMKSPLQRRAMSPELEIEIKDPDPYKIIDENQMITLDDLLEYYENKKMELSRQMNTVIAGKRASSLERRSFKYLRAIFSFKLYGNDLLTKSSHQWLVAAKTLVFIIAAIESLSWGYFGSLLGAGYYRLILAIVMGIIGFFMIWFLNSSLITLDRRTTFGKNGYPSYHAGMIVRAIMATICISITTTFLSQLVFNKDVDVRIQRANNESIGQKRNALIQSYDHSIDTANKNIQYLNSLLVQEITDRTKQGTGKAAIRSGHRNG